MKFTVGDIVTVVDDAPYIITTRESTCKVIDVFTPRRNSTIDGIEDMAVEVIDHKCNPGQVGSKHYVFSKYFKIVYRASLQLEIFEEVEGL